MEMGFLTGMPVFFFVKPIPNLLLYSPYYAEACNEFAVPISAP